MRSLKQQDTTLKFEREYNEQMIFIINRLTGMAPYAHEFTQEMQDPQMLSGFISAMQNFMSEVAGIQYREWKVTYGQDTSLIVEPGNWAIGVLAVKRETNEARSKLRKVVAEFEETFHFLKDETAINGKLFADFDKYVRREFIANRLTKNTRIIAIRRDAEIEELNLSIKDKFEIVKMMQVAQEGWALEQLASVLNASFEEIADTMSLAIWLDLINVIYVPNSQDILAVSPGSLKLLFSQKNSRPLSKDTLRVIARLDGRKPLKRIMEILQIKNTDQLMGELGILLSSGYLQNISIEKRLLLLDECVLSGVLQVASSKLGVETTMRYLQRALDECLIEHPWLARIFMRREMVAYISLDESVTPRDMTEIGESISVLLDVLCKFLQRRIGKATLAKLRAVAAKKCNKKWERYILETLL